MIHVTRLGDGDVSLILHGFAGSGAEMLDLAERLPGRKLVADLPGHGAAAPPREAAAYKMETTVEALTEVLDDVPVAAANVVGYSMGGRVALALAALRPERVRSVAAIGARTGIRDPQARSTRLDADRRFADEIEHRGADWFAQEWLGRPLYRTQRSLGGEHMAAVLERRRSVQPVGLAQSLRYVGPAAQPDVAEELAASGVPVLLIVGALDSRFRTVAEDVVAVTPAARLQVIPDAGHATHVEAPAATAAAIVAFWERVS